MSFINYSKKEINCKIVYYGAGLSGKTTNVQYVFENTNKDNLGKLINFSSENERTLFFDFLPLSIGDVNGYKTRFHLYSVAGQSFYDMSKQFILKGVDGVVFVVDSTSERMDANIESFNELEKNLSFQGYDFLKLPLVFQYNKRDVEHALSINELELTFNSQKRPFVEAVASSGKGVMETLQKISQCVIRELKSG